jgi:predicted dehydrogenase
MHINHLADLFGRHPKVKVVACADTVPDQPELREGPYTRGWNVKHIVEALGVPKTYGDYRGLLRNEACDIVVCCAENARHAEVVEACAAAGVHAVVEKPMASSLEHGLRMVRAAKRAGTKLIVNWPMTWDPAVRKAKELIDAGAVGGVIEVKWRGGHTGPLGPGARHPGVTDEAAPLNTTELGATWWHHDSTGGGAFLDYCCYGAMVSRWLIGEQAVSAVGMRANLCSQWADADDNGAMIVRFPGAIGLFEASWTTWDHGVPYGPIIYGTKGVLVVETRNGKRVVREEHGKGKTKVHVAKPLPRGSREVSDEFIRHIETGSPLHPTLDMLFNLEAMAILDAGFRSTRTGKLETVDSVTWRMG